MYLEAVYDNRNKFSIAYAELLYSLLQNHVEGYHELSSKTQIYFSTAVAKWDADFYIKVDDDVHINLG